MTMTEAISTTPKTVGEGISPASSNSTVTSKSSSQAKPRRPDFKKLYALPIPLRTFPLPTFLPHNPISLFHLLYTWLSQTIRRPSSLPEPPFQGWWSPETRSVHVTDNRSTRGLWEQGFYGKGNLSRSEPNWMTAQLARRSMKGKATSEEATRQRRAVRQQTKWERARKEQQAIEQTLREEAAASKGPVGMELRPGHALNLTESDLHVKVRFGGHATLLANGKVIQPPVGPKQILSLPNSSDDLATWTERFSDLVSDHCEASQVNGDRARELVETGTLKSSTVTVDVLDKSERDFRVNGDTVVVATDDLNGSTMNNSIVANGDASAPTPKSQKSVRFSNLVVSSTAEHASQETQQTELEDIEIEEQEHFQLTLEEAFFLSYALGVLTVLDPATRRPLSNKQLFKLFRQASYFSPLMDAEIAPDNPFMINYVVYHHFRSLGWVVRGGVKFAADFMLYKRGPVFSHAEFAIIILPSYSDPYWSSNSTLATYATSKERRTWAWFHSINRVITQVRKTLVLVYVDIPAPVDRDVEDDIGVDGLLRRYKVQEVIVQRWLSNRQRE